MATSVRNLVLVLFLVVVGQAKVSGQPSDCKSPYNGNNCAYDRKLAHPRDPSKFLQCLAGSELIKTCPDGLVFDAQQQTCDHVAPERKGNDE